VPNPDRLLRAGQFVRVVMPGQEMDAVRVPQQAVQEIQGKRSVFVVGADNKVEYREIVANTRLDNDWVVEGGLKADELVIVEGVGKVRPGMTVKPVPATLPAGDAGKGETEKPPADPPKGRT
jgi:membrane fusion protein (multidrug efflux system)